MKANHVMYQPSRLDVLTIDIDSVDFGDSTGVSGHTLTVSTAELSGLVLEDTRIAGVEIEIARPGENVRIVHCLDTVEPRTKVGAGVVFPGLLGAMDTVGQGGTLRLSGISVLTSIRYPHPFSVLLQARQA